MPKKFVFVLMPFSDDFTDIYKLGIKKTCEDTDLYCERVDEQIYDGSMLDRIYNQIVHADVIVADMTGQNPNVFYEVGFAHALKKKVILITQNGEDIPFDMKHFFHIIYQKNKISQLCDELRPRLKWYLSEDLTNDEVDSNISIYKNDTVLKYNQLNQITITLAKDDWFLDSFYVKGPLNTTALSHAHSDQLVYFSLYLPAAMPIDIECRSRSVEIDYLPNGTKRYTYGQDESIRLIPGRWWLHDVFIGINCNNEQELLKIVGESYEARFVVERSNAIPIEYDLIFKFNLYLKEPQ